MMKTRHEKTLSNAENSAEVDALLAAIDPSGPEKRPVDRVHNGEEQSVANAWELDIQDGSATELDR